MVGSLLDGRRDYMIGFLDIVPSDMIGLTRWSFVAIIDSSCHRTIRVEGSLKREPRRHLHPLPKWSRHSSTCMFFRPLDLWSTHPGKLAGALLQQLRKQQPSALTYRNIPPPRSYSTTCQECLILLRNSLEEGLVKSEGSVKKSISNK